MATNLLDRSLRWDIRFYHLCRRPRPIAEVAPSVVRAAPAVEHGERLRACFWRAPRARPIRPPGGRVAQPAAAGLLACADGAVDSQSEHSEDVGAAGDGDDEEADCAEEP